MSQLILIEGIPGSGKTTTANKLKDYLKEKGLKVEAFDEGDIHPADMAWHAYLSNHEFNELLLKYPQYKEKFITLAQYDDDHVIIPYLKLELGKEDKALYDYFESHEVYDARVPLETFKTLHLKRWKQFADINKDNETIYIFECAYSQNHVNELMLHYNKDLNDILPYMKALISTVSSLNPSLIYLSQPDVNETIAYVAKERVSKDKSAYPDWIDFVVEYIENSLYGKTHDLKGLSGTVNYFKARKKVELEVINSINIKHLIIENKDRNWDEVFKQILGFIE